MKVPSGLSCSPAALRLLKALQAAGTAGLQRESDGGCRTGRNHLPAALVQELLGRDLLMARQHRLYLTAPGERLLERAAAPKGSDVYARQNRILQTSTRRVAGQKVTVNLAESPLGWLKRRALISDRQWTAGERLRDDYYLGNLPPRVTMCWDAPPPGKVGRGPVDHRDPALSQMAARRRFGDAMQAAGPGLSDVLWRVVCAGEGIETAERALGWPARAGKLVLTLGLDRVATFYKL